MRAEVRFRWSQEVIAGNKLIRGGMETEPCDNSSISFRQVYQKIAQIEISLVGENRLKSINCFYGWCAFKRSFPTVRPGRKLRLP